MGFIMDGLDLEDYDRTYTDRALLARIVEYFRPHLRTMGAVGVLIAAQSTVEVFVPLAISRSIDLLGGHPTLQAEIVLVGAVLILGFLSWLFNYLVQSRSARIVGDVVLKLRQDVLKTVLQRDMSFYDDQSTGKIVSRVTSDTQDFSQVVTLTMNLLSQLLMVVLITGVLLYINVRLALITLVIAPVIILLALSFRRIARQTTLRSQRMRAKVNANIQESISGIAVAKSFRQEASIYSDFHDLNYRAYRVNLLQGLTLNTIFPVLNVVAGIGTAVLVYFGGLDALGGQITPGQWYLFIQALGIFWFPLTSIASFWSQFQGGLSASERVFSLMDSEPRVIQIAHEPVGALQGKIEFDHVRLSYSRNAVVLPDFSLTIEPGQTVAFVGHTGAGKSSIVRLIARFYEFQGGQIRIDGRDIRSLDLAGYRRQLGIVPQVPFLFSGTIRDNIRYGMPDADDEAVAEAARQVGGGDWLLDLPDGLDTDVGERGARLSMGQRQLVALARVVLQNPAVFMLDEATASIDPFTEAQIQDGLDLVMRRRTSILVAHRLSTVKHADRIIVMKNGEIIEEGTHRTLLAAGGHYAELYNTYFRHQSIDYIEMAGRRERAIAIET